MARKTARRVPLSAVGQACSAVPALDAAWVYGSFLRSGSFKDLDVGILLKRGARRADSIMSELARRLEGLARVDVDLHDLEDMPFYVQHRVIREGKVVFCRHEDRRVRFESAVLRHFQDYGPVWERMSRDYFREMARRVR